MRCYQGLALLICCLPLGQSAARARPEEILRLENQYARLVIGADGRALHFADRRTGTDYGAAKLDAALASVKKAGKTFPATAAAYADGRLRLQFGASGINAILRVTAQKRCFVVTVDSVSDPQIDEMTFVDLPLTLKGDPAEPFAGCAVALNLQTNVPEIPGANSRLRATCYPRTGLAGASVALIGCPPGALRKVLQEVVRAAPELPHSAIGGPWALDGPDNRKSYLFNFRDLTEQTVDDWIRLAQSVGIRQIDFHGGQSFRFGDFRPDPTMYPRGFASLKAVLDKLHAAGIQAGLHTYAFFIDKSAPWVTPVPDPRLGKDATFTLAEPLTAVAATVPVAESTAQMSTITGFFVRNSVTIQIDDELITYSGLAKEPPYAFTQCKRGAYGTRAAAHAQGAPVHHLRECFGRFVPDGDSTLFTEVAAKTAEAFNEAGFDMIYLDALDGEDVIAGPQYGWHYGSKFVFEICKRLKKPAIMEMSTFHHHLWFVRSRMGAWDHPTRSHKQFIDLHCRSNEGYRRNFLPGHLGWWAVKTWSGAQGEPTFADDIEYLCAKVLGTGDGFSIMGIDPSTLAKIPAYPRLAAIMKQYEDLRLANYFTEAVKEKLRVPGDEFTLFRSPKGEWQFRRVQYAKQKIEGLEAGRNAWQVTNRFGRQPLRLRIEALLSAGAYDAPGNVTLADFSKANEFPERAAQTGMQSGCAPSPAQIKVGAASGCFTAVNGTVARERTWCRAVKTFTPPLNLSGQQALGVWVYGDGKGEVLNIQFKSPLHLSPAIADHYIPIDFTGWRYFELIEPEGARYADYAWPYGGIYAIYRESIQPAAIQNLSLYYNNLPPSGSVTCYLSPIRALPTVQATLRHPAVTVGGKTITFPVEMASGSYLEFRSPEDCVLYGPNGEVITPVKPQGEIPLLEGGANSLTFTCETAAGIRPRARVTVISQGEVVRGARAGKPAAKRAQNNKAIRNDSLAANERE